VFSEPFGVSTSLENTLAIHVDQGLKGEQVVDVMNRLLFERDTAPSKVRVDRPGVRLNRAGSLV
jgi:hypothetical protein